MNSDTSDFELNADDVTKVYATASYSSNIEDIVTHLDQGNSESSFQPQNKKCLEDDGKTKSYFTDYDANEGILMKRQSFNGRTIENEGGKEEMQKLNSSGTGKLIDDLSYSLKSSEALHRPIPPSFHTEHNERLQRFASRTTQKSPLSKMPPPLPSNRPSRSMAIHIHC